MDGSDVGPLSQKVLEYTATMERLVPTARDPADWEPLAELVAVEEFERVGVWMEVMNWEQYTQMLAQWAAAETKFETTVRRISELGRHVYFEVEERHFHGERVHTVNSMTVFAFDDDSKIRHLDVYLQQPR